MQSLQTLIIRKAKSVHWIVMETSTAVVGGLVLAPALIVVQLWSKLGWTTQLGGGSAFGDTMDIALPILGL